ncbi:hypothetical protein Pfo_020886 [Paulownia fortunei]|nr:hypothetical protein Pfo_020886 [Paulownia fortunei]
MPILFHNKRGDIDEGKLQKPKMKDERKFGEALLQWRQEGKCGDHSKRVTKEVLNLMKVGLTTSPQINNDAEGQMELEQVKRKIRRNYSEDPLAWWDKNKIEAVLKIKEQYVSAHSCTKGVLESIPNLKKLGIRIELAAEPLSCFDHISHLHELESLKCVIVNPELKSEVVAPPIPLSIFPSGLKKLSLSGFGYPWEEMSKIASLPNLKVLKLRCYAFRGPEWRICEGEFSRLNILLLEDTDLVHWRADDGCFHWLERLIIRHCYKLKEIPFQIESNRMLNMIELVDCNPSVVASAKQMHEDQRKKGINYLDFHVHSSWDDGNLKLRVAT